MVTSPASGQYPGLLGQETDAGEAGSRSSSNDVGGVDASPAKAIVSPKSSLKKQPSALAFWQNQTNDSQKSSTSSQSPVRSLRASPMATTGSNSSGVTSPVGPSVERSFSTHPARLPESKTPTRLAGQDATASSRVSSDAAKGKRRKQKLVEMKRRHDLKMAKQGATSPPSSDTAGRNSPSHLDVSEIWSSNSESESANEFASDEEREVSYSGIDLDERLGIGSSSSRRSSIQRPPRSSLQGPVSHLARQGSSAMAASRSHDTALAPIRQPDVWRESGSPEPESDAFYDVDEGVDGSELPSKVAGSSGPRGVVSPHHLRSHISSSSGSQSSSADEDEVSPKKSRGSDALHPVRQDDYHSWLNMRNAVSGASSSTTLRQEHLQTSIMPPLHRARTPTLPQQPATPSSLDDESPTPGDSTPDQAKESSTTGTNSTNTSLPSTLSSSIFPLSPLTPDSPSKGVFPSSFLPSPPLATARSFSNSHHQRTAAIPPPRPLPNGPLPPTPSTRPATNTTSAAAGPSGGDGLGLSSDVNLLPDALESSSGALSRRRAGTTAQPLSDGEVANGLAITDVSLGPSGTIRGRPRGATIGAVPSSATNNRPTSFLGRMASQQNPRPRSLLSHELVFGSEQEPSAAPSLRSASATVSTSSVNTTGSFPGSLGQSRRNSFDTGKDIQTMPSRLGNLDEQSVARQGSISGVSQVTDSSGNFSAPTSSSAASVSGAVTTSSSAGRSRSGSTASLLQQVQQPLRSHATFVIAVVGHRGAGKSSVIRKGLRQYGLTKPQVLSEKIVSHTTICFIDQETETIEVLEVDTSVLLSGTAKRFTWPKFLPPVDAVILCYDASRISSFRGMSELLENFSVQGTSTVMLACKSDISPKEVDPYYASEMAGIYNVGLAECSDRSDEGKKRMKDCFAYLVKEVVRIHPSRARKGSIGPNAAVSPSSLSSAALASEDDADRRSTPSEPTATPLARTASRSSQASHTTPADGRARAGSSGSLVSSGGWDQSSVSNSNSSSGFDQSQQSEPDTASGHLKHHHSHAPYQHGPSVSSGVAGETILSEGNSFIGDDSENDAAAVQESITKAKLGLQSAKSVGGYVTIEELWNKLFFAAVSRNDSAFVQMFMVFYRGFVRPIELLKQMIGRFNILAEAERSDGAMTRFSLIRLAAMLSDWMQDYPGDLSGSETYPVLCDFIESLCFHPATMHVAAQIAPLIDKVATAPDLDAAWSKDQDSSRPKSVAADVPPVRPNLTPDASQAASPEVSTHHADSRARSHSDASSSGIFSVSSVQSDPASLVSAHKIVRTTSGTEARARSGSDVTSSSGEAGSRGHQQPSSGAVSASSIPETSSHEGASIAGPLDPHQQKVALRNVSNQLGVLDDAAIAGELTHLEWQLFLAIRPRDLLRHILVPREVRGRGGPVAGCIAHFNYISFWVCSMILVQSKTKQRARMVEKFMSIAAILRHDNNYNTLQAVLAGLGNAAVHRLRMTRELVASKPVHKMYQSLTRLMGSDRSFAAYRLALENSDGRTIPYLGVHLQDILSISDGNPSKRASDDMVHWRKFSLMDEAVRAIVRCQDWSQRTKGRASISKLIMDLPVMDDDVLYNRSLQVEPRASQGSASSAGSKIFNILKPAMHG